MPYGTRAEIRFGDVAKPYGLVSNLFPCVVVYDGKKFNSAEALFQWSKYSDSFVNGIIRNEIQYAKTPLEAWMTGKNNHRSARKDWEDVKDGIMGDAIWLKFSQN